MAMKATDVLAWLCARIGDNPSTFVHIDDGGMCLEDDNGNYIEIGGDPEEDEDDTRYNSTGSCKLCGQLECDC